MYVCMYVCMTLSSIKPLPMTSMYVCMRVRICMYACMYLCAGSLHTYMHTNMRTHKAYLLTHPHLLQAHTQKGMHACMPTHIRTYIQSILADTCTSTPLQGRTRRGLNGMFSYI
jgi:hypothetical protein